MGNKQNKKLSKENENLYKKSSNFKEKTLFQSFQEKTFSRNITTATLFKFQEKDIIINNKNNLQMQINSSLISDSTINDIINDNQKINLERNQLKFILFLFLATSDNIIYAVDSHSFNKLFKFRNESKVNKDKCKSMIQSKDNESLLICRYDYKVNINKLTILFSANKSKSKIYCDLIQIILIDSFIINNILELSNNNFVISFDKNIIIFNKNGISDKNKKKEYKKYNIKFKGIYYKFLQNISLKNNSNNNKIIIKQICEINNENFVTLFYLQEKLSIIKFFNYVNNIIEEDGKEIILKSCLYKFHRYNKFFLINKNFFGLVNTENIIIISSQFKQIVSIYQIFENNINNIFVPNGFILFDDYTFMIEYYQISNAKSFFNVFKIKLNNDNFVEIVEKDKVIHKKKGGEIESFFNFSQVKNNKSDNFKVKFFITKNLDNKIQKWIITSYEKD